MSIQPIRSILAPFVSAIVLAIALSGCSSSGEKATEATQPGETAALTGAVDVQAFKGGYDIDFYQAAAKEFSEKHPGLTVKVDGNPRVWESLRPRLVGGNPPDLMFPGWGMDHWALVQDGQLMELDAALDGKPYEGDGTWRGTFDPNVLNLCKKDGKTYMLPFYVMIYGWWYDPGVFKKNGWTPPKTYDELLVLSEKIKAAGMAPITYQGQYPYYMIEGLLLPWAASIGGMEAVDAAQNLEPGAWTSPAMLQAAKMIQELKTNGFFQEGATGMSHTEAQTQFLNGKAAMVPCGSWLESEMRSVMPQGAALEFMPVPVVAGGKGDPTALLIGIEPWMVPKDAKNAQAGIEFYKFMTSVTKAKQFVEEKGSLTAIVGSDQAKLPATLVKPAEALKSSKGVWAVQYRQWYPAMQKEIEGALTSMLNGEITPEQFCARCEAAAKKTREDPNVAKYKVGA
jgi:N-acetylglucosamine transport system substrate-binding protein